MNTINDDFYKEVGYRNYKQLIRSIPEAFDSKPDGIDLTIGDFIFSQISKNTSLKTPHYKGTATFLGEDCQITFEFEAFERDFFVDIRNFSKVNLSGPEVEKKCTCDSHSYFWSGCKCGAQALNKTNKGIK